MTDVLTFIAGVVVGVGVFLVIAGLELLALVAVAKYYRWRARRHAARRRGYVTGGPS